MCDWRPSFSDGTKMWSLPIPWPVKPAHAAEFHSAQFQRRSNIEIVDRTMADQPWTIRKRFFNEESTPANAAILPFLYTGATKPFWPGIIDYLTGDDPRGFEWSMMAVEFTYPAKKTREVYGGKKVLKNRGAIYFHDYMVHLSLIHRLPVSSMGYTYNR